MIKETLLHTVSGFIETEGIAKRPTNESLAGLFTVLLKTVELVLIKVSKNKNGSLFSGEIRTTNDRRSETGKSL